MSVRHNILFTYKAGCPYCEALRSWCRSRNSNEIQYTELDSNSPEAIKLRDTHHHNTNPLVIINGEFIGGYSESVPKLHAIDAYIKRRA